jgi:hypothetical protein
LKESVTTSPDGPLGFSGPRAKANYLRLGLLAFGIAYAGYVATWIALNVFSHYPLEFRENAVLFTADLQNRGENPYALEYRPVIVNVYGIGYCWICYPFTRLFGCHYTVLRLVSCAFIIATCLVLVWALRIDGVSWIFAAVAALCLFVQLGQGLSIVARPDSFGLFLFFASLVIPYRFRFCYASLFCNALLSILGFLTKPYFLLGLCLVWLYVFLFESKYKAVVFGTVAALALIASIWMINLIYECYFTETFFVTLGAAMRSWAHLGKIGGSFLVQNAGLLLILAAGLFHRAVRRRADIRVAAQQEIKRGWFNCNQFHQPLVCQSGDLAGLALVCNTAVIVLVLGLHEGNDILYYHQLIAPFLLWKVVRLADTTFRQHWLASTLLLVNLLILGSAAAPLPADHTAHWRALESLVASSSDVFAAPHLALLARQSGKTVYDAGQTEYAFAADHRNFTRVSGRYQERNQLFLQMILAKMQNKQFDLIIINWRICPFLPLEELARNYTPTGIVAAPMAFNYNFREFPLICWVPKEPPSKPNTSGLQR